jgi:hypothetical protein
MFSNQSVTFLSEKRKQASENGKKRRNKLWKLFFFQLDGGGFLK